MSKTKRNCNYCGKSYLADNRNLKRGWGLTCSKSCAAHKREKNKPSYNPERVERNNIRRAEWNDRYCESSLHDDDQGWDAHKNYN